MKSKTKLLVFVASILWAISLCLIFVAELLNGLPSGTKNILLAVSIFVNLLFNISIIIYIVKQIPKISKLRVEYVEQLKPKTPLRFCPSDEELVKNYQKQMVADKNNENSTKEDNRKINQDVNDEEIVM